MASTIGLIRAKLNLDASGFRQGLERAQSAAQTFQKKMRRVEYRMKRFGRKMESAGRSMTMGLTVPIVGAATAAVRSAAKFESLGVQMEVLTGSAEAGAKAFENLKRFSARTPFQLTDLTRAQNTLMGFGLEAEEAFTHLQRLGDVAAVTGGDLQAISVAFGQAAAEGKLMTRDIRQLINQGVPAIKLLAESMGVAQSEVLKLAEQGEITFDVLVEAFDKATRSGGQFANGTERLADTLTGVWSTLRDNVSLALGEIGTDISETLDLKQIAKNVSTQLGNITKNFSSLSKESKIEILKIAGLLAAGGPLLLALGKAAKAVAAFSKFVRSKFFLITASISVVIVAIQNMSDNWDAAMSEMARQTESWAKATNNIFSLFAKTVTFFNRALPGAMQGYFTAMDEAIMVLQDLDEKGADSFTSFGESGKKAFQNVQGWMQELIAMGADASGLNRLLDLLKGAGPESGFSGGVDTVSAPNLISEGLKKTSENLDKMKAKFAETGSISQVALKGIKDRTDKVTKAAGAFGETMADAFAQAALHGENLLDILGKIAKQLAARAFVKGIGALLTGGASLGAGGFLGAVFGFAQGGRPPTHQVSLVGERGPELFVPDTAGTVVPISGDMAGSMNIRISGTFRQQGTDLVAVIDQTNRGTLR